ncbi:hypothetical protein LINGRAHAP2_LOCUS23871 [Linum grandiflorum]
MKESEITRLLGLTRRREIGMSETMQQYLARWDARDDHVAETGPVRHLERWHFHDQYMDWYRTFSRWWISRRCAVQEAVVSLAFPFVLGCSCIVFNVFAYSLVFFFLGRWA